MLELGSKHYQYSPSATLVDGINLAGQLNYFCCSIVLIFRCLFLKLYFTISSSSFWKTLNKIKELCNEFWITLACGCWKVTLELLMSDEYLNKWVGEVGNLWLLLGWLCRTAEKQMWTVSFNAFIWDSCPQTRLHRNKTVSESLTLPCIHMRNLLKH